LARAHIDAALWLFHATGQRPTTSRRAWAVAGSRRLELNTDIIKPPVNTAKDIAAIIEGMKELVIGNVIFLGEIPSLAGTWQSDDETATTNYSVRARFFADRLLELGVDECTTDPMGNPVGIIKGSDPERPPILVVAELDSLLSPDNDIHYILRDDRIHGPGIMDNAIGAAAIISLPDVIRSVGLRFRSTLMLAGVSGTMADGRNLMFFERFLDSLQVKPCAAIIVKGGELGRLNYFTEAVVRADIVCTRKEADPEAAGNMVVVANEIMDRLLAISLPQKPRTTLNIGILKGGYKYGTPARNVRLGIEIRSTSNDEVSTIIAKIRDIISLVRCEMRADISYDAVAELGAANLGWDHPLTRAAVGVLSELDLEPEVYPSVSELYYFLVRGIPAITLGVANGDDYHQETAHASVPSLYRGLAQLLSLIIKTDEGACRDSK
jgi:acetylornithine deacetylase/succinyl-diaminopimelate desuccinylase-like protein